MDIRITALYRLYLVTLISGIPVSLLLLFTAPVDSDFLLFLPQMPRVPVSFLVILLEMTVQ